MKIYTERLILIPLTADQLDLWVNNITALENDLGCSYRAEPMEGIFKEIVEGQLTITQKDQKNYIWHTFWLIIRKEDNIIVGAADFKDVPDENGEVEIGYGLGKEFEHMGYMTEAVTEMCSWALHQKNVNGIIAETDNDGFASQNILKRCGFIEYSASDTTWWRLNGGRKMKYIRSQKYNTPELMAKIMGPNPVKLEEELMQDNKIPANSVVMDLGSGQGLTSVFLAKEYGFTVYAADLWSEPQENRKFFDMMGLTENQIIPVKADAENLTFKKEFFDAVVSTDSYNYFGRNTEYLDAKLLPFVKKGGYIYIAIPGMKKDIHNDMPQELLLSWTPEQLDYIHDISYWTDIFSKCQGAGIVSIREMESNDEVWDDWIRQDNEYAVGDRKSINAGAGKYLNFIAVVLRKK